MLTTYQITLSGRVQGVYYRKSTLQQALKIGITGFVQNLNNGDVLIVARGTSDQLNAFMEWCNTGPENAIVESLTHEPLNNQEDFASFEIRY